MRLKAGRPDLARYRGLFTVPVAAEDALLSVTWLGVSTLLLDDGESAVMTDGFFSRPPLGRVAVGSIAPSPARVEGCLTRAGVDKLAAVACVHTHFDHALDSALVAERTGAVLVGGESTANIGRGHPLPADQIAVVTSGQPVEFGPWSLTLVDSHHCPPDRYPGAITEPVRPPVRTSAYRCGEAWSVLVWHRPTDRRCLIQGSAGYVPGVLNGYRAEVAYLGLGQLGLQTERYLQEYWAETVLAVGARTVIGIHWDDFFRPLSEPLRALPFAGDDLDFSMRVLRALAERDGVTLQLPTVWRREDPWA
ncbi:MAG: MBL fold metallo-hydrolase [Mycobacterium sp.]|nr:MBL fold metallo-hydrolase [Mycobacterium sp.]